MIIVKPLIDRDSEEREDLLVCSKCMKQIFPIHSAIIKRHGHNNVKFYKPILIYSCLSMYVMYFEGNNKNVLIPDDRSKLSSQTYRYKHE